MGLLGAGGFGAVTLQYDSANKATYALKYISKGFVMRMHLSDQICNERKILSMTNSPFIAKYYGTYNSSLYLYFLLE